MVSKITTGYPTDEQGRPYKRRRYAPAAITVAVLLVLGVIVWSVVLTSDGDASVPTACNQPSPPSVTETADAGTPQPAPPTLTRVPRDEMLDVAPAPLPSFQVRVLNASGERGAARSVSEDLAAHGFTPAPDTPYADDTIYQNQDLNCVGQIRFGPSGRPPPRPRGWRSRARSSSRTTVAAPWSTSPSESTTRAANSPRTHRPPSRRCARRIPPTRTREPIRRW